MQKQNPYIWAIILITTACWGTWFYWTQVRPVNIWKECSREAGIGVQVASKIGLEEKEIVDVNEIYKIGFDACLDKHGMKDRYNK